ncbi:MAG TPA: hypothetical protein VGQ14_03615 [Candidatus Eisenbacteria bacterium]|nr:hypothetical protein [Candidatus Eisenbacteria bacterium]
MVRRPRATADSLLEGRAIVDEDPGTRVLIERLRPARERGRLTRGELLLVARWKSPRALPLVRSNSPARVQRLTRAALSAPSEGERLESLTSLRGVSVPTASAALTLIDPERYGVIDIRVWRLLHGLGVVDQNPRGAQFTVAQWERFLSVIRALAARHGVSARAVERTLFAMHVESQVGRLYDAPRRSPRTERSPS